LASVLRTIENRSISVTEPGGRSSIGVGTSRQRVVESCEERRNNWNTAKLLVLPLQTSHEIPLHMTSHLSRSFFLSFFSYRLTCRLHACGWAWCPSTCKIVFAKSDPSLRFRILAVSVNPLLTLLGLAYICSSKRNRQHFLAIPRSFGIKGLGSWSVPFSPRSWQPRNTLPPDWRLYGRKRPKAQN
jgi:hypothetical protein